MTTYGDAARPVQLDDAITVDKLELAAIRDALRQYGCFGEVLEIFPVPSSLGLVCMAYEGDDPQLFILEVTSVVAQRMAQRDCPDEVINAADPLDYMRDVVRQLGELQRRVVGHDIYWYWTNLVYQPTAEKRSGRVQLCEARLHDLLDNHELNDMIAGARANLQGAIEKDSAAEIVRFTTNLQRLTDARASDPKIAAARAALKRAQGAS